MAKVADVNDAIQRVLTLRREGDQEGAEELAKETREAIKKAPSGRRTALREALAEALKAPAAVEGVPTKESLVFDTIPGGEALKADILDAVGEGLRASAALDSPARRLARLRLEFGLRLKNKYGDPDIQMTSQRAKGLRDDVLRAAGLFEASEEQRNVFDRLWDSVNWHSRPTKIEYVKGLDDHPEEAAKFRAALEAYPDLSPSEAVFTFHKVPRLTVAEERALKRKQDRELGGADPYMTAIDRAEKVAASLSKEATAKKLPADKRAELRERIDDLTSALALARARLRQ